MRSKLTRLAFRSLALSASTFHEAEGCFIGHMADRLLHLARHDDTLPDERRPLFALGLTGLDVGYACLQLRRRLDDQQALSAHHRMMIAGLVERLDLALAQQAERARTTAPVASRTGTTSVNDDDNGSERVPETSRPA